MKKALCVIAVLGLIFSISTAHAGQKAEEKAVPASSAKTMQSPKAPPQEQQAAAVQAQAKAEKTIRQTMRDLGFRVGWIKNVGENKWKVDVVGWEPDGMSPAFEGAVNWDPIQKTGGEVAGKGSAGWDPSEKPVGKVAKGKVGWDSGDKPAEKTTEGSAGRDPGERPKFKATIECDIASNGIVGINSNGFKGTGISLNASQLQGKVGIIGDSGIK